MSVDLIARFQCRRGEREATASLIAAYAEVVRRTAGTLRFEVYTDAAQPESFIVVERYADQAAFEAHVSDPENARFNGLLTPLITSPTSQLTFLTPCSTADEGTARDMP